MADLSGVRLKLSRALDHLLSLDTAIDAYLDSDPVKIVREIDPRHPERIVFSMALKSAPPTALSVFIGDCVHNLRVSLDHLAWQLVLANGGVPREGAGGTQFPILLKSGKDGTTSTVVVPGGVSAKALTAIDAVQPFHRPDADNHPLAILSRLDNIDKHRTLLLSTAQSVRTQAYLSSADGSLRVGGQFQGGVVRPGDPIGVFHVPLQGRREADLILEAEGDNFVALAQAGDIGERPVTEVLEETLQYVDCHVIGKLASIM